MPDSCRSPGAPVTDFLRAWSGGDRLTDLAKIDERKARVVEMRVFAGLSVDESAWLPGVSSETIGRDWKFAGAWPQRELTR
jgi:DNA-directed RNA polymerase specialized sigma24 family protein